MSVKTARHRLLYLKDSLQGFIFAALSKLSWFTTLTPTLAFAIRPLLGITLTTLALLQLWTFSHTANKNLDGWMNTISSLAGSLLNNVAAFGGFIARATGTTFVAAPWFFVAGFCVGALYQLIMTGVTSRRAYESPARSHQRQHSMQAAWYHLINATQLSFCASAIVVFNAFPAASFLVTALALAVVFINICNSIWRFISSDTKKDIKTAIGVEAPEKDTTYPLVKSINTSCEQEPQYCFRFFTTCDHSEIIKEMAIARAYDYLEDCISKKLAGLDKREPTEKNLQKIAVLELLKNAIREEKHHLPDKGKIHKKYPRVIENFWCEKSETDQLIDAVIYYCKAVKEEQNLYFNHKIVKN